MSAFVFNITDCADPQTLAEFWSKVHPATSPADRHFVDETPDDARARPRSRLLQILFDKTEAEPAEEPYHRVDLVTDRAAGRTHSLVEWVARESV